MMFLKFLGRAALATNLTYRILVTSLLIGGLAFEAYKQYDRSKRLKALHD